MIEEGRVCVGGERVTRENIGRRVNGLEEISVDGKIIKPAPSEFYFLYKPKYSIVSRSDEMNRQTIYDFIPEQQNRLLSIGRLDFLSEGLLLLTSDPSMKHMIETSRVKREYEVKCMSRIPPSMNKEFDRIREEGIRVDDIDYKLSIRRKIDVTAPGVSDDKTLQIVLQEGKNREIRNVLEYLSIGIESLIRVKFGNISIGDFKTNFEKIDEKSVQKLVSLASIHRRTG